MAVGRRAPYKAITLNNTMTGNVVMTTAGQSLVSSCNDVCTDGVNHVTTLRLNSFYRPITADADLAFGQKLFTFPSRVIQPLGGWARFSMNCPTGLSTTAGEVALGTVVGAGAVSVLTGTGTFNNLLKAETLTTVAANTTETQTLLSAGGVAGVTEPLDGITSALSAFFNIASAWNQTSSENVTFSSGIVVLKWADLGTWS